MNELAVVTQSGDNNRLLVRNAFYGDGGFNDGGYLERYDRETDENFQARKRLAYYFNYTKPMVEGAVDPVFREYPSRVANNDDDRWEGFLLDVDGMGTPIDQFMAEAALEAKLNGSVFIVVDNEATEVAATMKESIEKRQYPYLYMLDSRNVVSYVVDRYGKLIMIQYIIKYSVVENGSPKTITENWKWTNEEWVVLREGQEHRGVNSIGVVPVVPLVGAKVDKKSLDPLRPMSDFLQIAKTNRAIYNACSELRQRNRSQAFSLLTYPVPDDENPEKYKTLVAGHNNALLYKGGSAPAWITPDQAPSDMLKNEIDMLVEGIYRMAERSSVTGVQTQTSGIAKEWDNFTRMQSISAFSKVCQQAEQNIATIFGLYIDKDLNVDVTYAKDFGVTDTKAELDKITEALDMQIGGKFDTEAKKMAAKFVLKDLDDDVIKEVLDDIDERGEDMDYSNSPGNE